MTELVAARSRVPSIHSPKVALYSLELRFYVSSLPSDVTQL